MKVIIAITLIALGAYFVYDAGKTIYNAKTITTNSLEYASDGEYQEVVAYEDSYNYNRMQTYTFLIIGAALVIFGGFILYFTKRKA